MNACSKKHSKAALLSFLPAILLLIVIFCFSAQDGTSSGSLSEKISREFISFLNRLFRWELSDASLLSYTQSIHFLVRKAAHMTEYFLLSLSLYLPIFIYLKDKTFSFRRRLFLCFTLCLLFAAFDELHQTTIPGRSGNGIDVLIDSVGNLCSCLLLIVVHIIRKKHRVVSPSPSGSSES